MNPPRLEDLLRAAGEVNRLAAASDPRTARLRRLRWAVGIAAACALAAVMPRLVGHPVAGVRPAHPVPSDAAAVVALFRTWSEECDCPAWTIYDWDRGLHPDSSFHLVELSAAADAAPVPIDPAIVLAIAPDARDLPRTDAQKRELLRCLDGGSLLVGEDVSCFPQIVRSCLPETVQVVTRRVALR